MQRPHEALPAGLRLAGTLLIVTGVIHCLGWLAGGWNSDTQNLIYFGVLYLLLGALLRAGVTKTRYFAILSVMIGGTASYMLQHAIAIPGWLTWIFIVFDAAIFVLLFISIWRGREEFPVRPHS